MEKLELAGTVNQAMTVKAGEGVLAKGTFVKISGNNEVRKCNAVGDKVFGFVYVPNSADGEEATIVTRFRRIATITTGGVFAAGDFVNVDAAAKVIKQGGSTAASATITVVDYSIIDAGDKVTINGVDVVAGGTDFTAATSNTVTAANIATAINGKVPGVRAIAAAGVVTVYATDGGSGGNAITLTTNADVGEMTVSGATFSGGVDFFPMGMALEASSGADQSKVVGFY